MNLNLILLQAESKGFDPSSLLMMGAIVLVFYFFMIRPQQKKQKDLKKFREAMKTGEKVVTSGGIHGKLLSVRETDVDLEIDRGIKIRIDKASISHVEGVEVKK